MEPKKLFSADVGTALIGFYEEAALYCQGISAGAAHDYAMDYTRVLQNRAKGFEAERTRFTANLFEPNRKLIQVTLDKMYSKYFKDVQKDVQRLKENS